MDMRPKRPRATGGRSVVDVVVSVVGVAATASGGKLSPFYCLVL
jgi:hypothetical protein